MAVTSYDPKKVSCIVSGQYITGFMDSTFIQAEKNEDNVTPHIGAQGDVTFAESADDTGTITITLKQDSTSLPFLRTLATQKRNFPTQIIDANGTNLKVGGTQCRILKTPGAEFGAEVSGVEIQIYVADYSAK